MRATGGFSSFNFTSTYGTSASLGFVHGPWGGSYFDGYMVRRTSPSNERGGDLTVCPCKSCKRPGEHRNLPPRYRGRGRAVS